MVRTKKRTRLCTRVAGSRPSQFGESAGVVAGRPLLFWPLLAVVGGSAVLTGSHDRLTRNSNAACGDVDNPAAALASVGGVGDRRCFLIQRSSATGAHRSKEAELEPSKLVPPNSVASPTATVARGVPPRAAEAARNSRARARRDTNSESEDLWAGG